VIPLPAQTGMMAAVQRKVDRSYEERYFDLRGAGAPSPARGPEALPRESGETPTKG
jgi:hypothetical protein